MKRHRLAKKKEKKKKPHEKTRQFMAGLFMMAKIWKSKVHQEMTREIKLWYINTMEFSTVLKWSQGYLVK